MLSSYLNFHFMNHRSLKVIPMCMLRMFSEMRPSALALRRDQLTPTLTYEGK